MATILHRFLHSQVFAFAFASLTAQPSISAVRMDTLTLFDGARQRPIPIAIYQQDAKDAGATGIVAHPGRGLVIISHGYNENQPGTFLKYSYLGDHLASNGYTAVSIQHELATDDPLPMKGDLAKARRPNWERGVQNIHFVLDELKRMHPDLDPDHVALIGHSNGGDISLFFAQTFPDVVEKVITLDNRRMPLPRTTHPRILSLRSSDQPADEGVLPTPEEQAAYGIQVITLKNTRHVEMNDRANAGQRREIEDLVLGFLNGP